MASVAGSLKHLSNLEALDLSWNQLGDAGVVTLTDALASMRRLYITSGAHGMGRLQTLSLDATGLGVEGLASVVHVVGLLHIVELSVADNAVGADGGKVCQ